MKNILVSACLLGVPCRYDGTSKPCDKVAKLKEKYNLIAVCPEVDGGLPFHRAPAEIVGDKVIDKGGCDVTAFFEAGAKMLLQKAQKYNCKVAVLKSKSPSCGTDMVYDGTFSGRLIPGTGVAARLLKENGVFVVDENSVEKLENLDNVEFR